MLKTFKTILMLCAVVSLSMITSCSKKDTADNHVKSIQIGNNIVTFLYDNQGRLTSYTQASGTITIQYSSSIVTVSSGNGTSTFQLNSSGLADNNGAGGTTYQYDGNGYLVKAVSTANGSSTTNYAVTNGNTTSVTTDNNTTDVFTYTTTSDNRNYGFSFLGKNSTPLALGAGKGSNLVATDVHNNVTYQYTYTYDTKGRVQTQTTTGGGNTTTEVFTYNN